VIPTRQDLHAEAERRWAALPRPLPTGSRAFRSGHSLNSCSWFCWVDVCELCPGRVVWYTDGAVIPCSCRCHRAVR
jgi:hypothetical protein